MNKSDEAFNRALLRRVVGQPPPKSGGTSAGRGPSAASSPLSQLLAEVVLRATIGVLTHYQATHKASSPETRVPATPGRNASGGMAVDFMLEWHVSPYVSAHQIRYEQVPPPPPPPPPPNPIPHPCVCSACGQWMYPPRVHVVDLRYTPSSQCWEVEG